MTLMQLSKIWTRNNQDKINQEFYNLGSNPTQEQLDEVHKKIDNVIKSGKCIGEVNNAKKEKEKIIVSDDLKKKIDEFNEMMKKNKN